ncbi:metallophosphoesterase [Pseudobacteriovorax antillogorgiicola]|uniref:Calcineurin-like phosphoesterase n=1 Tax=Pseudobacteriovorax antillogorgiicola TaxID=1513793 RepID=A0A1Y6BZM3_9BACT|nr:metallophosphoesterase [Pseudobacteriovorax antillogorgiicola]TCS53043.1 calcineurin-like phosphoesterase family protein [Pseudobacteriovorax antillogorgiicola]SMF26471.1 Calcineurin-like phosphoesterase [Pseudobacteriovorax antillogorgiicola]
MIIRHHYSMIATMLLAQVLAGTNLIAKPFRFVALPDTQIYTEDYRPGDGRKNVTDPSGTFRYFTDQTQWVAENADSLDIKMVVHLGDIVNTAQNITQWERAKEAMDVIDRADIPYGMALGNHDVEGNKDSVDYSRNYRNYFGPQLYNDRHWYGGSSPSGESNYQLIEHEGTGFIFLNIALNSDQDETNWADQVLSSHRDRLAIITTHKHLQDFRVGFARYGEKVKSGILRGITMDNRGSRSQEFYDGLIQRHANIIMVLSGHFDADFHRNDGFNGADLPIYEVLADFQGSRNGGDGYLKIFEVDLEAGTIKASTYSPSLDRERTIIDNFVESIDFIYSQAISRIPENVQGISEKLVNAALRDDVVKGVNVIENHPVYQKESAYYETLLADSFGGAVPQSVGSVADWEGFWIIGYASDRDKPLSFGTSARSSRYTMHFDFERYITEPIRSKKSHQRLWSEFLDDLEGIKRRHQDLKIFLTPPFIDLR